MLFWFLVSGGLKISSPAVRISKTLTDAENDLEASSPLCEFHESIIRIQIYPGLWICSMELIIPQTTTAFLKKRKKKKKKA